MKPQEIDDYANGIVRAAKEVRAKSLTIVKNRGENESAATVAVNVQSIYAALQTAQEIANAARMASRSADNAVRDITENLATVGHQGLVDLAYPEK